MSPPPNKEQKEPNKNPSAEDIPSLEDIIGQMPKPEVDDITKLQVKSDPITIKSVYTITRLVKYPMPAQFLVLSESNTITKQSGQGSVIFIEYLSRTSPECYYKYLQILHRNV